MIDNWIKETGTPVPTENNPDYDEVWNNKEIAKYSN